MTNRQRDVEAVKEALREVAAHSKVALVAALAVSTVASGYRVLNEAIPVQESFDRVFTLDGVFVWVIVAMMGAGLFFRIVRAARRSRRDQHLVARLFAELTGFAVMWGLFSILVVAAILASATLRVRNDVLADWVLIFVWIFCIVLWSTLHVSAYLDSPHRTRRFFGRMWAFLSLSGVAKDAREDMLDRLAGTRDKAEEPDAKPDAKPDARLEKDADSKPS